MDSLSEMNRAAASKTEYVESRTAEPICSIISTGKSRRCTRDALYGSARFSVRWHVEEMDLSRTTVSEYWRTLCPTASLLFRMFGHARRVGGGGSVVVVQILISVFFSSLVFWIIWGLCSVKRTLTRYLICEKCYSISTCPYRIERGVICSCISLE